MIGKRWSNLVSLYSSSRNDWIGVWNIHTGLQIGSITSAGIWVTCFNISHDDDGLILIGGAARYVDKNKVEDSKFNVRLWSLKNPSHELIIKLESSLAGYGIYLICDNQRLISCGRCKDINIWNVNLGSARAYKHTTLPDHCRVRSIAVSLDELYLVSGYDNGIINMWNLPLVLRNNSGGGALVLDRKIRIVLSCHSTAIDKAIYSVLITSDNTKIIAGSHDHSIRIWSHLQSLDAQQWVCVSELTEHITYH